MPRYPVAVLGATGTVGQKLIRLLETHPWFEVTTITASDANVGRSYVDAVRWREPTPIPERIAGLLLRPSSEPVEVPLVFSALDTVTANQVEPSWARAGAIVSTNASPRRLDPDVPLVIPEVNAAHFGLIRCQKVTRKWKGGIVANPNCTTTGLVLALAPLHQAFGIERLFVSTMQAMSGAGYPGVASLDIVGNVVPHIAGEEEKVEAETRKLFGRLTSDRIEDAKIGVSAHTNRVPVIDGHLETVSVGFSRRVAPEEAREALLAWEPAAESRSLPSTPARAVEVEARADRPQPRLDLERGGGMAVTVGRIRPCPLLDLRLVLLSHNTIRGAAGGAIQNAELVVSQGALER